MKHRWNIKTGPNWSTWRQTFQSLTKKRGLIPVMELLYSLKQVILNTFRPSVPSGHPNISFISHNTLHPLYLKLLSLWCKIHFCSALEELCKHFSSICNSDTRSIHTEELQNAACSYTPANEVRKCLACWCRKILFHSDISEWNETFHACFNKITM
jgi:hypothetical protein